MMASVSAPEVGTAARRLRAALARDLRADGFDSALNALTLDDATTASLATAVRKAWYPLAEASYLWSRKNDRIL